MADEKLNTNKDGHQFISPKWINVDLIQRALKNGGEEKLQVKELSMRIATAPGDNYSSTMYRVTATLSDGSTRSFVVKGPAPGAITAQFTTEAGVFVREAHMLANIIPEIEALLEEAAPGKFPPLAARCPLHGSDPVDFLVLEDLAPQGFKLADRKRGLGLRHSLLALRALARYHAASHVLIQRRPEIADSVPNEWKKAEQAIESFMQTGIQAAAHACRLWPGFEEYATIFDKYKPVAMQRLEDLFEPKPGGFNVILHSDFWVNNMMFRYTDGNLDPKGHRMVDFQGSAISSPAIDLLYFFSTSVTDEVSAHHEDLLVREYHHELKETLALLGAEAPSMSTLLADMDEHGLYALMGTLNVIPVVRAQQAADLEAIVSGDVNSTSHLYEDPPVKKWMQRVLPEYKRRGWLPC